MPLSSRPRLASPRAPEYRAATHENETPTARGLPGGAQQTGAGAPHLPCDWVETTQPPSLGSPHMLDMLTGKRRPTRLFLWDTRKTGAPAAAFAIRGTSTAPLTRALERGSYP